MNAKELDKYNRLITDMQKELAQAESDKALFFTPVLDEKRMKHSGALLTLIVAAGWTLTHWQCATPYGVGVYGYPIFERTTQSS